MSESFNFVDIPINLANQLPTLLQSTPQLIQQMLGAQLGPIGGQLIAPMIMPVLNDMADRLTGTDDSDLRFSDTWGSSLVSGLRTKDYRRRKNEIITKRVKKDRDFAIGLAAEADVEQVLADIYGVDEVDSLSNSWAAKGLRSLDERVREASFNAGVKGLINADMAGARISYGANKDEFVKNIGLRVSDAVFGVDQVAKGLSDSDITQIVEDFARSGGFSSTVTDNATKGRELVNYIKKIADGVDNIKQVMGDNVTAEAAKKLVIGLTGTSAAALDGDVFSGITKRFKQLAYSAGVNEKDWGAGTAAALQQLGAYGVPQAVATGVGLDVAAAWNTSQNRNIGVSDKEYKTILASIASEGVRSGAARNVETARATLNSLGVTVSDEMLETLAANGGLDQDELVKQIVAMAKGANVKIDESAAARIFNAKYHTEEVTAGMSSGRSNRLTSKAIAKEKLAGYEKQLKEIAREYDIDSSKIGRDITSMTPKELHDRLLAMGVDSETATYMQRRYEIVDAGTEYGTGTINALRGIASDSLDKASKEEPSRYRLGLDGIIQYMNDNADNATIEDMISVYLQGRTGSFQNKEVTAKVEDALKNKADIKLGADAKKRIEEAGKKGEDARKKQEDIEYTQAAIKQATDAAGLKPGSVSEASNKLESKSTAEGGSASAEALLKAASELSAAAEALKNGKIQLDQSAVDKIVKALNEAVNAAVAEELKRRK